MEQFKKNKKGIMAILVGLFIACAVIGWLFFGGTRPVDVVIDDVHLKTNASMKDTLLSREQDGKKLWEFKVKGLEHEKQSGKLSLLGIEGRVFKEDGTYIDVWAEKGTSNMKGNNFTLEGKVKGIMSNGGKITCDRISWTQKGEKIDAFGNVTIVKSPYIATGDEAHTTGALKNLQLKGHAKFVKGDEVNDKE